MNLLPKIAAFLEKRSGEKFSGAAIAQWIFDTYPQECRNKQKRSKAKVIPLNTDASVIHQISREIAAGTLLLQKRYPAVRVTEGRPRLYYYSQETDQAEVLESETRLPSSTSALVSQSCREHALYEPLAQFLWSELRIYSKRIDEKRSRNMHGPGGNKWLYPDLVGLEELSAEWQGEVKDCVQQYGDKKTKLWSFGVKVLINRSNVREAFFQTVSNSSWANFGYFVAAQINGTDTLKELRILSALHGIGLIQLNVDMPCDSQIIIPAKERDAVDWNTVNRLVEENKDFAAYVKWIRHFYQTGEVRPGDWINCQEVV